MANLSQIKLPNGTTYDIKDNGALQLTGGQVTGPVTFGDSVSIDEATLGDLVVNGSASFTNNIQANTINGVAVGSSPKFTDTNTEVSTLTLAAGSTAGTALTSGGKFTLTAGSKTVSFTMPTIPSVPSNIVNTITTTAGAHTAISSKSGAVSFNVPTTAAHVGAATSDHVHGNITNGGDITATAPTIASGDQIIINDNSASKITNGPTFDGSTTTTALTPKGTWESFAKSDTNTTYALSGALSSHKFTSTLTAGGSGSGTSTSDFTLAAGTGITITDDTSARKMTIACSVTNTDTKVSTATVTNGVLYFPIVGEDITDAATKFYDKTGLKYFGVTGTTSEIGSAVLTLGNSTASGTANNKQGELVLYGSTAYAHTIKGSPTAGRTLTLPNATGTIALTDNIPTITLNGTANTSPSFYAPTTAGTNGYVLKSNGSGAPTWTSATLTDEKVQTIAASNNTTYYLMLADGANTKTRQIDSIGNGLKYNFTQGTTTTVGTATLLLGNLVASGNDYNSKGILRLHGTNARWIDLISGAPTATRTITLPDDTGTLALDKVATTSASGLMSSTDKLYLDGLSDAIETTSSTITIKNGSSGVRAFYLETSSSDTEDTSLISAITSLGWDSDVIVS